MIIGAKKIIEIIGKYADMALDHGLDEDHKMIKNICERWIDIQENDGNPHDTISLVNTVLVSRTRFHYDPLNGLNITMGYVGSTPRAAFLATVNDTDTPEAVPDIERNFMRIDADTAISMAHRIIGDQKPVIIREKNNNNGLFLGIMNNLQGIIENQQETIDALMERITE